MKVKMIQPNSAILHRKLELFDFKNPPTDPVNLVDALIEKMKSMRGIGLSANQVGLPYRVFVMESVPAITCFNPRIVEVSNETITMEEGCLSYPGLYVKIKRPKAIKARYFDVTGEGITREFDGITARCFLHELDHMDGIDFLQRANAVHRNRAMKKWKKNKKFIKRARAREKVSVMEPELEVPETFTYSTPE